MLGGQQGWCVLQGGDTHGAGKLQLYFRVRVVMNFKTPLTLGRWGHSVPPCLHWNNERFSHSLVREGEAKKGLSAGCVLPAGWKAQDFCPPCSAGAGEAVSLQRPLAGVSLKDYTTQQGGRVPRPLQLGEEGILGAVVHPLNWGPCCHCAGAGGP